MVLREEALPESDSLEPGVAGVEFAAGKVNSAVVESAPDRTKSANLI